ncbi:MAG: hypothetical protein AAGC84_21740 [Pseudomonas sp.]
MSDIREVRFINGSGKRTLLIIEPRSCEFWIKKGATLRIVAAGGARPYALEVEYLPNGLVVYTAEGSTVSVYENEQLLPQTRKARHLGERLGPLP